MSELNFGINAGLVEELFAQYLENPESVDTTWRVYFDRETGRSPASRGGVPHLSAFAENEASRNGASKTNGENGIGYSNGTAREIERAFDATIIDDDERSVLSRAAIQARVYQLLNAYRVRGHFYAKLNPLGDIAQIGPGPTTTELALENFQLSEADLDKPFPTIDLAGPSVRTLRDIIEHLEETYCRSIGVEFTQIEDPDARNWLRTRMEETRNRLALTKAQQLRILEKLTEAEVFEQFVHGSYGAGTKRFSLEGAESMISFVDLLIERSGEQGVEEIVVGMAHRGRLNMLVNIMKKSLRDIFAAFEDKDAELNLGRGDVKYHLGYSTDCETATGAQVHLTLTFNPSHLEFVNPVVEGRVRAKQDRRGPNAMRQVMPLLIHGDAAFIGQGVVPETLNLVNLDGYRTGGTIHLIVNNQIGFTTDPTESRSTRYASDITRMLKVPVFHVNGEDPEAVAQVAMLAIDYRQRFGQDVVIDMYCYRKYGHNEGDEPRYTQPRMYQLIDKKPTVRRMYIERLQELGHITEDKAEGIARTKRDEMAQALKDVKEKGFTPATQTMGGVWTDFRVGPESVVPKAQTGVTRERLIALSEKLVTFPEGFHVHPKVLPLLRARHEKLISGEPFDWGTAELLAYASLVDEGTPIRLSGQDVRRGTFSHRHSVMFDVETGQPFSPLSALCTAHLEDKGPKIIDVGRRGKTKPRFDAWNSPLSEAGVLGFEFGYSLDYPEALVIWEAQFGDFLNGAQVIVDQFITSSEEKWHRMSGIVLYLPHGYEGQGPEHSSCRIERFLQNAAEDNIQVCNLTTPAQLFHALRRQILRSWRKPLIIATPKSLLRVAATSKGPHRPVSTIDDLTSGIFQRVIGDTASLDATKIRKVLLCSGKVYYDLAIEREARGINDVAIIRLEQLYPVGPELREALSAYAAGTPLVWVQEEPKNYGGWYYVNALFGDILEHRFPISCVAREASASPATGSRSSHLFEQSQLLREAFA